jgi:hypothetical protein
MTAFTPLIGRFGNQLFQYAYARAMCEQSGLTLATPPWIGERIFNIPEAVRCDKPDHTFTGYAQDEASLVYSRRDVLNWLRLRPEIQAKLDTFVPQGEIVAHIRRGDYVGYGCYPLVSKKSYLDAAEQFGFDLHEVVFVTEENPIMHPDFSGELSFLPDFYRLVKARVIFRGNSSFSWWSATLSNGLVFSPVVHDKAGGVESDCDFVAGNWPKLANLPVCTDLHLKEQ